MIPLALYFVTTIRSYYKDGHLLTTGYCMPRKKPRLPVLKFQKKRNPRRSSNQGILLYRGLPRDFQRRIEVKFLEVRIDQCVDHLEDIDPAGDNDHKVALAAVLVHDVAIGGCGVDVARTDVAVAVEAEVEVGEQLVLVFDVAGLVEVDGIAQGEEATVDQRKFPVFLVIDLAEAGDHGGVEQGFARVVAGSVGLQEYGILAFDDKAIALVVDRQGILSHSFGEGQACQDQQDDVFLHFTLWMRKLGIHLEDVQYPVQILHGEEGNADIALLAIALHNNSSAKV